jgi:hypothetical protein
MNNDPSCDLLKNLSPEIRKLVRQTITSMVLGTDMANHFEYLGKFKAKKNGPGILLI